MSLPDKILTFGGYCDNWPTGWLPTNYIMRYEIDQWSQIGKLLTRRWSHNAFLNEDRIFIIGGYDYDEMEITTETLVTMVPEGAFFGAVGGGNTCLIYFAIAFLVRSIFLRNF